ncbi:hypothetical protein ACEV8Z_24955, partial [Vibrio parahaemolyticus]
ITFPSFTTATAAPATLNFAKASITNESILREDICAKVIVEERQINRNEAEKIDIRFILLNYL